jgi:hypothetical protein
MIEISLVITADTPDGAPWPPSDGNALWVLVRRTDGCTLWRAIKVRSAAAGFSQIFMRQQLNQER